MRRWNDECDHPWCALLSLQHIISPTTDICHAACEILAQSLSQLERDIHPVVIISAYNKALKEALEIIKRISIPIDVNDDEQMLSLIKTSIGTKFVMRWSDLMCKLALQAVRTVAQDEGALKTVDIKRYARVEKIPGGEIEQSRVLDGIMLNKDITHPKMRRRIVNPRIILLDCPLEYKKGESQTNIEISKEADWSKILENEEEQVRLMVEKILEFKPDLVITEKGVSGALIRSSEFGGQVPVCLSGKMYRSRGSIFSHLCALVEIARSLASAQVSHFCLKVI